MSPRLRLHASVLLLALFVASFAQQDGAGDSPQPRRFPEPVELRLEWQGDAGPTWCELLDAFAAATGKPVLFDRDADERLGCAGGGRPATLEGLVSRRELTVGGEDVYFVVETYLRKHNLVLIDLDRVFLTVSLDTPARNQIRRAAFFEPVETVERFRRHPAVLVTTWVPLSEETPQRTIANEIRRILPDANTTWVAPAGAGVAVTSFGPRACAIVDLLREIDGKMAGESRVERAERNALIQRRLAPASEEPPDNTTDWPPRAATEGDR